eukprot:TRINITY_DN101522_c0_g2_i1.p1 TRINITY_DN101522_c0_g2~~TRINITY_DN101522_c0_g2_i1.p1  ORF type:complete len:100 (-),score=10.16 TRINITY_DN101522_c0_g2_i1:10-309(-)
MPAPSRVCRATEPHLEALSFTFLYSALSKESPALSSAEYANRDHHDSLRMNSILDTLFSSQGRTALVTGGAAGMGYGIAQIGRAVQQECRDRSRMPSSA